MNATLLEIFLALTFLVLAVAWHEQVRAEEAASARARAELEAARLRARIGEVMKESAPAQYAGRTRAQLAFSLDSAGRALAASRDTIKTLQFQSRFPPFCTASDAALLAVTLKGQGVLEVRVLRSELGLTAGEVIALKTSAFPAAFVSVREYSKKEGCRFRALVQDTPETSKEEYKRALAAIVSTFYTLGAYREGRG